MSNKKDLPKVVVIHNRRLLLMSYLDTLDNIGFQVKGFSSAKEALAYLSQRERSDIEVVLVHKDIYETKEGIEYGDIIDLCHNVDENIRLGIVSGEHPHGSDEVTKLGADLYFKPADINEDWVIEQLEKGYCTTEELSRRGQAVILREEFNSEGRNRF
jgi:hypothetical protein